MSQRRKSTPKIQRWIDLLAALLRRRYPVSLDDLAKEVPAYHAGQTQGALRRMFERDKDELRACGVPIETVISADDEVGYRLEARGFYLPYLALRSDGKAPKPRKVDRAGYRALQTLTFEPDELSCIAEAAARLRQLGDSLLAEHAESAMRKLACDLPVDATAPGSVQILPPRATPSPELFPRLGAALERRKRVSFDYYAIGRDVFSRRTVESYGLFFLNQHWYLAARASDEDVVKNYRLSRIANAVVNPLRPGAPDYTIPADFRLRDHARSRQAWELGAGDAVTAVVAFRAETGAAVAASRLGEPAGDDPRYRRFQVRRVAAFARWLLSFAGDLVPVSPPALVHEFHRLVRATLARYALADD